VLDTGPSTKGGFRNNIKLLIMLLWNISQGIPLSFSGEKTRLRLVPVAERGRSNMRVEFNDSKARGTSHKGDVDAQGGWET